MKFFPLLALLLLINLSAFSQSSLESPNDSVEVNKLNKLGYDIRLTDAEQAIVYSERAMEMAKKINYINGIAEAYRVKGIGKYYHDQSESAIENYLDALRYFKQSNNQEGIAKVYNNIGNLYLDVDFDKSLEYLRQSQQIAEKLQIRDLLAGIYGNLGNIHQRKKNYNLALANYEKSVELFTKLNNPTGLTQILQNIGVAYFSLNKFEKAESYLLQAVKKAKENDLNNTIARSNITLASLYIAKNKFAEAKNSILEGITYSKIVKDPRLEYDYLYISYKLEHKQKNYQKALDYLQQVYTQDSIVYANNVSTKVGLREKQYRQEQKQRESELTIARQRYTQILFWASTIVALLAFGVIFLLIRNVKRSTRDNKKLTTLNEEVSRQKEDLDRINHNLEEIIDVRTKDLKIKNKKLSEYSSHLSHQIRGPIATLKGLMILEKDMLIEQEEFVEQLNKCIHNIDDKIIHINKTLNDDSIPSLVKAD
ncbi:tetratricopeptide repeat protein [Daejeonella oryzae]|uniref:tetratricopeptide repeat protein n=1 Tax=Daejeonella oryzae TaxID=1122943 RepID=UPI0004080A1B|nr:tetratricopeptide repeat protein [Daejeonella oryzae]